MPTIGVIVNYPRQAYLSGWRAPNPYVFHVGSVRGLLVLDESQRQVHRRACELIAAAARRKAQTAEHPQDWHPEGVHHRNGYVGSESGCNAECA